MSENNYLDTYYGVVLDVTDPDNPDGVELVTVRAADYDHARALVLRNAGVPAFDYHVEVHRFRAPTLVESPSDKIRRWKRVGFRIKSPQFNAKRRRRGERHNKATK